MGTYNEAIAAGTPWEDPGFPADDTMMFWEGWGMDPDSHELAGKSFKRPEEMGHFNGGQYVEDW